MTNSGVVSPRRGSPWLPVLGRWNAQPPGGGVPAPGPETLTGAGYRLPYKVSRSRRYWPESSPAERKANLLIQFGEIASALNGEIRDISIELPGSDSMVSTSGLKRYEDSLDALVCAWVGVKYLEETAVAYSDDTAAI